MSAASRPVVLPDLQRRVLWLVSQGYTEAGIAKEIGRSPAAVKGTCGRILRNLCAANAPHAVGIGLRDGHIGPWEDCGTLTAWRRHHQGDETVCASCRRGNADRVALRALLARRPKLTEQQVRLLQAFHAGRTRLQIREEWGMSEKALEYITAGTYAALGVDRYAARLRREAALKLAGAMDLLGVQQPSGPPTPGMTTVRLSGKQVEILLRLERGMSITEAAQDMGMSRDSCASRISQAYRVLGVTWLDKDRRRAEAISKARRDGFLPEPVSV